MAAVASPKLPRDLAPALALGVAGALSVVAVFPYVLELIPPDKLAKLPPLPIVVVAQALQGFVLFTLLAWLGLWLGGKLGLDAPRVRALLARNEHAALPPFPWRVVTIGAAIAFLAVVAIASAAKLWLPELAAAQTPSPAAWKGLLSSFYGGIGEELQLRLFLMTLLAWALARGRISRGSAILIANVLAALAFGAGHLPAAAQVFTLTTGVVVYIVSANAAAGLVFGTLYARHGLEAAMAAHFIADIGLHVVVPLVQGTAG